MKTKLLLFIFIVLNFTSCKDEDFNEPENCITMIQLSKYSLPIQMWKNNDPGFNDVKVSGIVKECWFQPWNCEDHLKWIFSDDDDSKSYKLKAIDSLGNQLALLDFDVDSITRPEPIVAPLQFTNKDFAATIAPWAGFTGDDRVSGPQGAPWTYIAPDANSSSGTASRTKYFGQQRPDNPAAGWPPGDYSITVRLKNTGSSDVDGIVYGMVDGGITDHPEVLESGPTYVFANTGVAITKTFNFTTTQFWPYLAFSFDGEPGFDVSVQVELIEIIDAPTTEPVFWKNIFTIDFVPAANNACNKYVKFQILDEDDVVFYKSDLQNIRSLHRNTNLVLYTNEQEWDKIDFKSKPFVLGVRIKSQLYEPDSPQEVESEENADGTVDLLMTSIKDKTLLKIHAVPPDFYRGLVRKLSCNSLYINNVSYKKADALEKKVVHEEYSKYLVEVWLTINEEA